MHNSKNTLRPTTGGAQVTARLSPQHPRPLASSASMLTLLGLIMASQPAHAAGPLPVKLGAAGYFVILSKAGIQDVPASTIVGNVGTSPITGAANHLACTEVTGKIFSVNAAGPAPCSVPRPAYLTKAIGAMITAYNDAAGRPATVKNLGAGNIGGLILAPGTYNWGTSVIIPTDVTLHGTAKDVWIFQVAQNVNIAAAQKVTLSGGANPANVFWQVAGQVTIGTTAHFAGNILSATQIAMKTGASINGRLYAQTAVTLEMNAVTKPHR